MKLVNKENLLEAIEKVEKQGHLLKCGYQDSEGCHCVVGFMMEDAELEALDEVSNSHTISRLSNAELVTLDRESLRHLSYLQSLNDRPGSLEEFLERSKIYLREV